MTNAGRVPSMIASAILHHRTGDRLAAWTAPAAYGETEPDPAAG